MVVVQLVLLSVAFDGLLVLCRLFMRANLVLSQPQCGLLLIEGNFLVGFN